MSVTCNYGETFLCGIEIDSVHHGTQFFLCSCKQWAVDIFRENVALDDNFVGIIINTLWFGETVSLLHWQREMSVEICNLGSVVIKVHFERQWLFGESLDSVKDVVIVNSERIICVTLGEFHWCGKPVFSVRCNQIESVVLCSEHEATQDSYGVLTVDYPCEGR